MADRQSRLPSRRAFGSHESVERDEEKQRFELAPDVILIQHPQAPRAPGQNLVWMASIVSLSAGGPWYCLRT